MSATAAGREPPSDDRGRFSFGPGLVFALAVLGTGDFVSNTAAGASYGYSLIWSLALTLVFRYFVLEATARYTLVAREGLLQGYARVGKWLVLAFLVVALIRRHTGNLYEFLFMGEFMDLAVPLPFEHSARIWSLLFISAGFAIMFWARYLWIETICKYLIALMAGSMLVLVVVSRPDLGAIVEGLFIPRIPDSEGLYESVLVIAAIIGAEIGLGNVTYSYFVQQKGWDTEAHLGRQRKDLLLSIVVMFALGAAVQIVAAALLNPQSVSVETTEDLLAAISDSFGAFGRIVFGLGLWAASFTTYAVGGVGYSLAMTDAVRQCFPSMARSKRAVGETHRDPVYRVLVCFMALSPLYVFFTDLTPVALVLLANAMLLPAIPLLTVALARITNDRAMMGSFGNSWLTNAALALLILVTTYLSYENALRFFGGA